KLMGTSPESNVYKRKVMARLKTVKSIFVNIFLFLDNGLFQPTAVQHLSVLLVPLFYGGSCQMCD
ncbi:hypothetical protein, partial [Salmonella enterica]|uniref:hypothetical protein n=1 Tax=Salmonella enterica TaxID=28901 RepID=UPI001C60A6F2